MPRLINWHDKRKFLFRVFNADSHPGLLAQVLGGMSFKDSEAVPKFADTMQRWPDAVTAKTPMACIFFERVASKLECHPDVTGVRLMEVSYPQFVALIPECNRSDGIDFDGFVEPDTEQDFAELEEQLLSQFDADMFEITFFEYELGQQPSVRAAASNGALDQRLFYQHPDCAEHWETIINGMGYPTFNKCKYSMDRMLDTPAFLHETANDPLGRVVMLGGGGGFAKDCSIIARLLKTGAYSAKHPLTYTLIDVSTHMLRRSRLRLAHNWQHTDWGKRVAVKLISGDFMHFSRPRYRSHLRSRHGPILWTLSGGTLGNISERRFFESLNKVAAKGDLFMLGTSILTDKASNDADASKRYLSPSVTALLRSPLQDLLNFLNSRMPVDRLLSSLTVDTRDGRAFGVTDIPDSRTAVMTATIGNIDYSVLNHTNYDADALIEFAATYGWKCIERALPGYDDAGDFCQFLFKKG